MWFFYLKIFLAEIWLTLATWSKSTITHHHHQIFKKEIDFFSKFCLANNWPWGITCSHKSIQQLLTSPSSGQSSLRLSVFKSAVDRFNCDNLTLEPCYILLFRPSGVHRYRYSSLSHYKPEISYFPA